MRFSSVKVVLSLSVLLLSGAVGGGSSLLTARPTDAGAPQLVAGNVHFRRDSLGTLLFFGEVVNRGTAPAASIGVEVSLYNKQGQRLARGVTLAASVNVVQPGAKAVWQTQMTDNPRHWARVAIRLVQTISAPDLLAHNYAQLRVSGLRLAMANPGYSQRLTGKVTNTGSRVAHIDAITAALYNARGRLVYVADQGLLYPWSAKQNLRPGQTAPFADDVLGYLKKPARIVMYVRAERQP